MASSASLPYSQLTPPFHVEPAQVLTRGTRLPSQRPNWVPHIFPSSLHPPVNMWLISVTAVTGKRWRQEKGNGCRFFALYKEPKMSLTPYSRFEFVQRRKIKAESSLMKGLCQILHLTLNININTQPNRRENLLIIANTGKAQGRAPSFYRQGFIALPPERKGLPKLGRLSQFRGGGGNGTTQRVLTGMSEPERKAPPRPPFTSVPVKQGHGRHGNGRGAWIGVTRNTHKKKKTASETVI